MNAELQGGSDRGEELRKERETVLYIYERRRVRPDHPDDNPLCAAQFLCLVEALRALMVDLPEIAEDYLNRSRKYLERVFHEGPRPYLGFDPAVHGIYWDNEDLDYHWSIAFKTRYLVELLQTNQRRDNDLSAAIGHIERLARTTHNFTGPTATNKVTILCDYMIAGSWAGWFQEALELGEQHIGPNINHRTVVKNYLRREAHLRFLIIVNRYASGIKEYERSAKGSFAHLMDVHTDFENPERTCWAGPLYAFDWAWVWECAVERMPSVRHAIDLIRGTTRIDPGSVKV